MARPEMPTEDELNRLFDEAWTETEQDFDEVFAIALAHDCKKEGCCDE